MTTQAKPKQAVNEPVLTPELPLDSEELGLEIAETAKSDESSPPTGQLYTEEEIQQLIAIAAYEKALKRGFAPGYEEQDWLEAEKEILNEYVGS
ncbi:MAG: hypothetical protein DM484_19215 [Candidatus Methylumidiphilus alinenensis]|uniref:DUF2934 domain-containing protein n=1 Tax=Candidatus Methylumidiphilus alinenensis TaxID=2202197 RepID=A0A2W4SR49_9GAMM|nr:MAG: hypothetical protein DM484_19215 [Candidatus Methylumidiphilus alinenensis]